MTQRQGPGWMLQAVIVLSGAPLALGYAIVVPILARMSAALAHDATGEYLVKMVFGVLGPAMVVGGAAGGLLADKLDRRLLLTVSSLLFAVAGAAPFATENLPLILVSRALMGAAAVTIALVGSAMVADLFEEKRRAAWLGAIAAVQMVGSTLSLPVSGALGEAGWRFPFLIYLIGLPIAALAWFGIAGRAKPSTQAASPPSADDTAATASAYPLGLMALGLIIGALMTTPGAYMPFRLGQLGLQNTTIVGFLLMLNALAGAGAAALYGILRRRLSPRMVFCAGFGALAVGFVVLGLAPNVVVATAGLLVFGLGLGWLTPNLTAVVVAAVDESRRGRALGAINAAAAIAPALALTALDPLSHRIGVDGVLILTGAVAGVMCLGTALAPRNRADEAASSPGSPAR